MGGPDGQTECYFVAKDCLNWSGVNLRLQVFTRDAGMWTLLNRVPFYKSGYKGNWTAFNPEMFEKKQLEEGGNFTICQLGPNELPVLAARHLGKNEFCFIEKELASWGRRGNKHCLPDYPGQTDWALEHCCDCEKKQEE